MIDFKVLWKLMLFKWLDMFWLFYIIFFKSFLFFRVLKFFFFVVIMGGFFYEVLIIIIMLFDFLDFFVVNVECRDSFFNGINFYEFYVRF